MKPGPWSGVYPLCKHCVELAAPDPVVTARVLLTPRSAG